MKEPPLEPRLPRLRAVLGSVRVRLTLWYVAILAVVLTVFGAVIYDSQARSLRADLDERLRGEARRLASAFDPTGGQIIVASTLDLLKKTGSKELLPTNEVALVLDREGNLSQTLGQLSEPDVSLVLKTYYAGQFESKVLSASQLTPDDIKKAALAGEKLIPKSGSGPPVPSSLPDGSSRISDDLFTVGLSNSPVLDNGSHTNHDYVFYSTSILDKGVQMGMLLVGIPREDQTQLQRLLWTLLIATPATLLLSALGGYWLAARAMRPVRLITHAAGEIGEGDLSRRLNLGGRDELGELASTFDRMLDRLESAFRRQRQFTTDASHELRTPLTIVNLEVNRVLAGPRTESEYRQALAVIRAENEQMSYLVNDLLMLARADAGQTTLQPRDEDLSDVALEVVERLSPLAHQRGVELSTGELPELPIRGDRQYLGRMIANLVENAIKYSCGSGGRVRVETGLNRDHRAWVRVTDNGPGIAPEHLPHLFDRFYRVDAARTRPLDPTATTEAPGGSGLGLSIVQWIAQTHNGEVHVQSTPARGSAFEVRLPALPSF